MNHDYYKEYYSLERKHWWFKAREAIIKEYIQSLVTKRLLQSKEIQIF